MEKTPIVYIGLDSKKPVEFMENNRPINNALVKRLEESMKKYGILSALTVYDTGDSYLIVDGQHRWTAASNLGLSMPAIITSNFSAMEAVMEMNTIGKNWSMPDYVEFYSNHDDPNIRNVYSTLRTKKRHNSEYNYGSIQQIFCYPTQPKALKEGIVRIVDEEMGDEIIRYLNELEGYLPLAKTTRFITAFAYMANHEEYSHSRMMRKLKGINKSSPLLVCISNPIDYGRMLTKIFNRNQTKNLTMFRSSWL